MHNKSSEVCIKTRSPPASLPFRGQVAKLTTVKWSIYTWFVCHLPPQTRKFGWNVNGKIKDVRAHCYCASLVRTLYMTWWVPHHVFQACALSRNSTKYIADDLCGNLFCEYFCWMLGDPHFFFGRSLPFLILSIILKKQKKSVHGKF